MGIKKLWLFVFCVCSTSCMRTLRPAPEAQHLPGDEKTAVVKVLGVEVVATSDYWRGNPANLKEFLTPIKVEIKNNSGRALELRYKNFTLESSSGFHSA